MRVLPILLLLCACAEPRLTVDGRVVPFQHEQAATVQANHMAVSLRFYDQGRKDVFDDEITYWVELDLDPPSAAPGQQVFLGDGLAGTLGTQTYGGSADIAATGGWATVVDRADGYLTGELHLDFAFDGHVAKARGPYQAEVVDASAPAAR